MIDLDHRFPSVSHLRERAIRRIPRFAFDYLDGGCNDESSLHRNTSDIRKIHLKPFYLRNFQEVSLTCELFGRKYSCPFGVSPIGLQGLIWPRATEILAAAAHHHNIPFILSTVGTASIEKVAEITNGNAWFQLYHPREENVRHDLLNRCKAAGYQVLVILADVPTFGHRPREIRNGLALPPRMTGRNIVQMITRPAWAVNTLSAGIPSFASLTPYMKHGKSLRQLGNFMNDTFDGRLTQDRIKSLREAWPGKLVIKGLESAEDLEKAIGIGVDGVIISNHGGRQLDPGESSIVAMKKMVEDFKNKTTIMMDSGIRSGTDIACCLAAGAHFTFMGRSFMYGMAALGRKGGDHTIQLLKRELLQVMEQIGCERIGHLPDHLVRHPDT